MSSEIIDNIVVLRDKYRIFKTMNGLSSKGYSVSNVMAFKRRDAMRYVFKEYNALNKLIKVIEIQQMPVISVK